MCEEIKTAKLPMMILGHDAVSRSDAASIIGTARKVANLYGFIDSEKGWNGLNLLHRSQGEVNALELGIDFKPIITKPKVIFLLGCDNRISPQDIPKDSFVVYIVSVCLFRDLTETKVPSMLMSSCLLLHTLNVQELMVNNPLLSKH